MFSKVSLILSVAIIVSLQAPAQTRVHLDSGVIEGRSSNGIVSFKGIPFAAPPVGPLRWRAPQPVQSWSGIKKATEYANDCMQLPFPSDAAPLGTPPAEDCLYANVWVPEKKTSDRLPVIVWIYGGGSVNGGASPAVYSGHHFAENGLVFVSFNYRLGRFGYFAHPALTAENADGGLLGNYGYMDQLAALRWVQKNVGAFGGDPANVTVFGESHGGRSVHMLLGTSLSDGLFQKAMIESGFGRMVQRPITTAIAASMPSAEAIGVAFAKTVGVEGIGPDALARLRALPELTIRGDLSFTSSRETYSGPMIDGKIIPEDTPAIYLGGGGRKVPLLLGANSEDTGSVPGTTPEALFGTFGPDAAEAQRVYTADATSDFSVIRTRVGMDRNEIEPTRFVARVFASRGLPVYEYRFSYVADSMRTEWAGAKHASEIPFVFDTIVARYGDKVTAEDEKTAHAALQYWVNFAKTGDPNGPGLPAWPRYSTQDDVLMNFTARGPQAMADPFKARLDVTSAASSSVAAATANIH